MACDEIITMTREEAEPLIKSGRLKPAFLYSQKAKRVLVKVELAPGFVRMYERAEK